MAMDEPTKDIIPRKCSWQPLESFLRYLDRHIEVMAASETMAAAEKPAPPGLPSSEKLGQSDTAQAKSKKDVIHITSGIPRDARVCVNHFIQWRREFAYQDLQTLAKRRAGCRMKKNQDGADLIVPAWWKEDGIIRWGAILIQVKNRVD
eukprot:scaffold8374_cov175-Amphora_coffeaeformis.AAC.73